MTKPNTQFKLSVKDIELIEYALNSVSQTREIQKVRAKIHDQKNWYRPKNEIYVSG